MRRWLVVLLSAAVLVACSDDEGGTNRVTVFAAASLAEAFTELGDAFVDDAPDVDLTFSFAGSSDLAAQILEGAPADVLATADLATMNRVIDGGLVIDGGMVVDSPAVFATNVAEVMVEAGNPHGIAGLADLADDGLVVVQCAPQVPCGAYADEVLAGAGVAVTPRSFESSVSGVVTKITLGEADAGIVYRTDVLAAGEGADGVPIDQEDNVVADYPIAAIAGGSNPAGAVRFIDFVIGDTGQEILASYGFGEP